MNVDFAQFLPNGKIVAYGSTQKSVVESRNDMIEVDASVRDDTHYVEDGVAKQMPPRPSPYHKFNYETRRWDEDHGAAWSDVRTRRQRLLSASDWAALPDVPIAPEKRQEWAAYRQALRDITEQPNPLNITWPTPPA